MTEASLRGSLGRGGAALVRSLGVAAALWALAVAGGGCATLPHDEPVMAERTPSRHRPPGIAVDPVLELPHAAASAEPVAGLAVLSEPVDPEPALRVVRAFFEAIVVESMPELELVVERGAHTRPSAKTRAEPALPWWRHRFDHLDYTALGAEVFYRRSDMEAHTARDAGTPGRPLPANPRGDDVVVRVVVSGQAADKLFGPELVFLVKKTRTEEPPADRTPSAARAGRPRPGPREGHPAGFADYKIAELFEDFRLP